MERRVLLAVTLSFVVLAVYQTLFVRPAPKRPADRAAAQATDRPGSSATPAATAETQPDERADQHTAAAGSGTIARADIGSGPAAAPVVFDIEERDIVVDSPSVRAVFTNRGAELKSWRLKQFVDGKKQPVDLVPTGAPASEIRGFGLVFEDAALTSRLHGALFRPSAEHLEVAAGGRQLAFEFEEASGLKVRKSFEFERSGKPFLVGFSAVVQTADGQPGPPFAVSSGPGLGDTDRAAGSGGFFSTNYYQKPEGIFQQNGKVTRLPTAKLTQQSRYEGRFGYIGSDDHYFLSALLPGDRNTRVDYRHLAVQTPLGPRDLVAYDARRAGGAENLAFYLGPKQFDHLAAVDRELVRVIDFGMFSFLVVPLLRALNWLNGYIGNYGWSIIILTVLINAAMFPLRHRSVVSMRKLQNLQPEVKQIQDRYAKMKVTDPAKQKMNTELMNLYRERGVNPASGCVPMILTFPVLFAFYAMLSQAIELRGAPFVGWIRDLSTHDPLYITPLLMGATMVWQQRITPSTADPAQQKMMMFMPIVFTFMFLWAPSGLVIYWFVSNVWAIGQQYLTNSIIGPAKPAPSAAERRASRAV